MTKRYRIYIGSDRIRAIYQAFDTYFDCYTVVSSTGIWHGSIEQSYIVEIIAEEKDYNTIFKVCQELKVQLNQESILMTAEHVHTQMI